MWCNVIMNRRQKSIPRSSSHRKGSINQCGASCGRCNQRRRVDDEALQKRRRKPTSAELWSQRGMMAPCHSVWCRKVIHISKCSALYLEYDWCFQVIIKATRCISLSPYVLQMNFFCRPDKSPRWSSDALSKVNQCPSN